MEFSDAYQTTASHWRTASTAVMSAALTVAPLTDESEANRALARNLDNADDNGDQAATLGSWDDTVADWLQSSTDLAAHLGEVAETDRDARQRLSALIVSVADIGQQVAAASRPPQFALLALGVDTADELTPGRASDVVDHYASRLMLDEVAGAAVPAAPPTIETDLASLETAAGNELVALTKNAIGHLTIGSLTTGLDSIFGGTVGTAFANTIAQLTRFWDRIKKAAVQAMQWVAEHLLSLLPADLQSQIQQGLDQIKDQLVTDADSKVGSVLGWMLGGSGLATEWNAANTAGTLPANALSSADSIATAKLGDIGEVSKIRGLCTGTIGSIALSVALKVPVIQVAYAITIAAGMAFVGYQLLDGFHEIGDLITVPPPVPAPAPAPGS